MKNFIINNYIIVIIVLAFFLFALIGYLIDLSRKQKLVKEDVIEEDNLSYIEDVSLDNSYDQEDTVLPEEEATDDLEVPDEIAVSDKVLDNVPEVESPNIN